MDFFEAQDFFKQQYPEKKIDYEFDDSCHRFNEIVLTDGSPNLMHHVECRKVKVTPEGVPAFYVPIAPHRMAVSWSDMKKLVLAQCAKSDVNIPSDMIDEIKKLSPQDKEKVLPDLLKASGLSKDQMMKKLA